MIGTQQISFIDPCIELLVYQKKKPIICWEARIQDHMFEHSFFFYERHLNYDSLLGAGGFRMYKENNKQWFRLWLTK